MDTSIVVPITAHCPTPHARDGLDMSYVALPPTAAAYGIPGSHTQSQAQPARRRAEPAAAGEIARLQARVRELSAQLVDAQEAARRHLARELHDGVGAELTATRFALASIETWLPANAPQQCAKALATAQRSLDAVCHASRDAVAELHGPALEGGLVGALSQWTRDFSARTGLRISLVCSVDTRLTRLTAEAALAVFRVAQEALSNAAKHATASVADVRIEVSRRHLTLIVDDDGIGISPQARAKRGHFGLSGMRARCATFDGSLRLGASRQTDGTQPCGTIVRARFAWESILTELTAEGRNLRP